MPKKDTSQIEMLQKKIEIAQEAVSKITDDSLKTVAFQTILQKLLNTNEAIGTELEQIPEVPKPTKEKEVATSKAKQPKGPKGRIDELITEGFFSQKRTIGDVKKEMEAHGWFHRVEELNPSLLRLMQDKRLRRIKEPENEGGKLIWRYSKW
jgi:regulator of replication initiation timing